MEPLTVWYNNSISIKSDAEKRQHCFNFSI
jgi:hypothetical protein